MTVPELSVPVVTVIVTACTGMIDELLVDVLVDVDVLVLVDVDVLTDVVLFTLDTDVVELTDDTDVVLFLDDVLVDVLVLVDVDVLVDTDVVVSPDCDDRSPPKFHPVFVPPASRLLAAVASISAVTYVTIES